MTLLAIEGVGDLDVAIQEVGPPTAPVVLLIHGSGPGASGAGAWRMTLPNLAENFRVVAPDLMGFGLTAPAPDGRHNRQRWLSQLEAVIDYLQVPSVHLVGSSLGGGLALHLAHRVPDRVGRLVLIAPLAHSFPLTPGLEAVWGYQPSVPAMDALMHTFVHDAGRVSPDIVQSRYENSLATQAIYATMFPEPRQQWIDDYAISAQQCARIPHPTLLVHGRDDQVIPFHSSLQLFSTLPNARILGLPACGHWPQIEHADEVNAALSNFLD